ncbi:zinc metalloprotease HtpX [archaeon]|nr:zinc metalloprotease HtpX [archaeon]MBT3451435.1 zinc metalloprotease HtpX [archaeon]MBT6869715.1 zinc metalloprotease HtpX [archaeon]MBT7192644.1 zinc metalloprotease HtpX [archaeon]MBT7380529.1 zinc metalloprotease HtpX [archaeon]
MKNQLKTALLLAALTSILLVIGDFIGGTQGLIIAFIFAGGLNFFSYWFSDKIVLAIYRAKEADKNKYSKIYEMVQDISIRAKLPMPKIYIIPSHHPNAFATGRNPNNAVVACTEGILNLLNDHELKGVIAHEMAHISNRDILIQSITATIAGVISFVAMMARWTAIFGGFGGRDNNNSGGLIELLVLAIVAPIMAMLIQFAISRSREYLADETGSKFLKDATGLASALEKLEKGISHNPLKAQGNTEATAHMFISNPFRGSSLLKIFSTHPTTESRVKRLRLLKF